MSQQCVVCGVEAIDSRGYRQGVERVIGMADTRVSFWIKVRRPGCQRLFLTAMLLRRRGLAVRDMADSRLGGLTHHDLVVCGMNADLDDMGVLNR